MVLFVRTVIRSRRTGAGYKITDCIKNLYKVMSIFVLTPISRIGDGLSHVESAVYMEGKCKSTVYSDAEIFIIVGHFHIL